MLLTGHSESFELDSKLSRMTAMTRLSMTNAQSRMKKQKYTMEMRGCGEHWFV